MKRILMIGLLMGVLTGCNDPKTEVSADASNTNGANASGDVKVVFGTGKILPESGIVNFSAPVGGIVKDVLKKAGESVSKDEPIVLLVDDIEQNKINEIRSQIETQRSQIVIDQTEIAEAQINIDNKKDLQAKAKRLVGSGAETQQTLDDITKDINVYQVTIDRAKAKVAYAKRKLDELSAQLRTAETEAQMRVFKSPFDGKVLDMDLEKGESVSQYAEYAEFAPSGNLIVKAQVDELFSSKLKVGQKVEIFFLGNDEVIATGEVIEVSPYLKKKSIFSEKTDDQEDRRVREVEISLENSEGLIINSKVDCRIKL